MLITGGPDKNNGESSVCMPIGFPADVEPLLQFAAGVKRSAFRGARHEAMEL